ncbi:MAG: CYTH domain-containing protein [Spirochaetota bacterium]
MAVEIERKFTVDMTRLRFGDSGTRVTQGYLSSAKGRTVRVRVEDDEATLTIKGPSEGNARSEFEYTIPLADAREMLDKLCEGPLIDKTRHRLRFAGRLWEIDVFHGDNEGLVVAEVEIESADAVVELPDWVQGEVSHDRRYFNSNLAKVPFKSWS